MAAWMVPWLTEETACTNESAMPPSPAIARETVRLIPSTVAPATSLAPPTALTSALRTRGDAVLRRRAGFPPALSSSGTAGTEVPWRRVGRIFAPVFRPVEGGGALGVLRLGGALAAPPAFASDHNVSVQTEDDSPLERCDQVRVVFGHEIHPRPTARAERSFTLKRAETRSLEMHVQGSAGMAL